MGQVQATHICFFGEHPIYGREGATTATWQVLVRPRGLL